MAQTTLLKENSIRNEFKGLKSSIVVALWIALLPSLVFGAVSYSRNPSGYTIFNPVSFQISFDDFSEFDCDEEYSDFWTIYIYSEFPENPQEIWGDWILPTTKSHTFVETLPLGKYTEIKPACCSVLEDECYDTDPELEKEEWYLGGIFEIVEAPAFIYLEIPDEMPTDMLAYAGAFFTDLSSLIVLAGGLPIGFKVIKKIIQISKP